MSAAANENNQHAADPEQTGVTTANEVAGGTASAENAAQGFKKGPMIIALVLALALVVAVFVGAKLAYENAAHQPVAMSDINSPDASTAECADLIANLPENLLGLQRAELADPAPAGAAAWQKDSQTRITLRCGVALPLQYNELSTTSVVDGTEWIEIADTTPQSTMRTWYTVNRWPVVAVTGDDASAPTPPTDELATAVTHLAQQENPKQPVPLSTLAASDSASVERCADILADLPVSLGSEPTYEQIENAQGLPADSKAWGAEGYEAIVVRCGVVFPEAYELGARLQQIDGVAWFEDTTLGNGTTASTWYAVNRDVVVAVSAPQAAVEQVLVPLGKVLEEHTNSVEGAAA